MQSKNGSRSIGDLARPAIFAGIVFTVGYALAFYFHRTPAVDNVSFQNSTGVAQVADSTDLQCGSAVTADDDFADPKCAAAVAYEAVRETVIKKVFKNESPWKDFPPPHMAGVLQPKMIKGWGSRDGVFKRLIEQVRPKTIIEVGTFLGASAIHMAKLVAKFGLQTQIICVDDFRGWPGWYPEEDSIKHINGDKVLLYQFMQNVVAANATDTILFAPFGTATALMSLCQWGIYGDLVEIDAGHDFHSAWSDINNGYKLLRPGGVLFGHDYGWESVRMAVERFANKHGFGIRVDGSHWILYTE